MREVVIIQYWDKTFFQKMADFKNAIHQKIPSSFIETLADYEKFFGLNSLFLCDYEWRAVSIQEQGMTVAQAILSWRKNSSIGHLGFIDWRQDFVAAEALVVEVEKLARAAGLKQIKTPVDLNFFVKYRIKMPGGGAPFFGEPVYPDYYHDFFERNGFKVAGHWDSYKVDKTKGIKSFASKRKGLSKRPKGEYQNIQVRSINLKHWEKELQIVHNLFLESYQGMPEFERLTFEQFKVIYDDFKYIINPLMSYIIELEGKPVGFNINYADPLKILKAVDGKKLNGLQKLVLLAKLRLNRDRLLIAYVGKIPGKDGQEIKGVQIKASSKLTYFAFFFRELLTTYKSVDSLARNTFEDDIVEPYSQYVLYGKDLK